MESGKAILVVDDESGIREFLAAYLKAHNQAVLTAASAEEAIAIWEDNSDSIHVVVTDIVMPGMNGKALAESLRAQMPDLKVIFMSGYLPPEIAEETLDGPFFKKPFNPSDLIEMIKSYQ